MKVLVTGGAGYIGAHVVRALAERGHTPVILDDLRASKRERTKGFTLETVALEDAGGVLRVMETHRPDAIIHLAGYLSVVGSVAEPEKYWANNVAAAASLTVACARVPVRTFVFSSTGATYGDQGLAPISETAEPKPSSPYGATKLAFEKHLHAAGLALGMRTVALRYFNAAGANPAWGVGEAHDPEEHLIPLLIASIRAKKPFRVFGRDWPTPDGTCVRDYVHVTDLAEAHVRVLEKDTVASGSMNLGTGTGHSVLEVARAVGRALGQEPVLEFGPRRAGDPPSLVANPQKLETALGWRPRRSLDEIVESALAWDNTRPRS